MFLLFFLCGSSKKTMEQLQQPFPLVAALLLYNSNWRCPETVLGPPELGGQSLIFFFQIKTPLHCRKEKECVSFSLVWSSYVISVAMQKVSCAQTSSAPPPCVLLPFCRHLQQFQGSRQLEEHRGTANTIPKLCVINSLVYQEWSVSSP